MKKIMLLALVAMLSAGSITSAYSQNGKPCNKECCKKCPDKCKENCKDQKCSKEDCSKNCEDKKSGSNKTTKA